MRTFVACALMAASACVANGQPVQWRVEDGGNGHWYEFDSRSTTWDGALAASAAKGGYLATMNSQAENTFVNSKRSLWNAVGVWCWLGGRLNCGNSTTVNCSTCQWNWHTGEPWMFNSFLPGEPNCGFRDECVVAVGEGWIDYYSSANYRFIVEYSADCNGDGIVDKGQILSGQTTDANNNGVPDGPSITSQPTDQTVGVNSPVTFIVEVSSLAGCSSPVVYRWQRRNPAVVNPNDPGAWVDLTDGGGFFGTTGPNLSISRPTPAIATGYRCRITGGCGCEPNSGGVLYSNIVNFSVTCPSDFNADGSVDGDDVIQFFQNWDSGC